VAKMIDKKPQLYYVKGLSNRELVHQLHLKSGSNDYWLEKNLEFHQAWRDYISQDPSYVCFGALENIIEEPHRFTDRAHGRRIVKSHQTTLYHALLGGLIQQPGKWGRNGHQVTINDVGDAYEKVEAYFRAYWLHKMGLSEQADYRGLRDQMGKDKKTVDPNTGGTYSLVKVSTELKDGRSAARRRIDKLRSLKKEARVDLMMAIPINIGPFFIMDGYYYQLPHYTRHSQLGGDTMIPSGSPFPEVMIGQKVFPRECDFEVEVFSETQALEAICDDYGCIHKQHAKEFMEFYLERSKEK